MYGDVGFGRIAVLWPIPLQCIRCTACRIVGQEQTRMQWWHQNLKQTTSKVRTVRLASAILRAFAVAINCLLGLRIVMLVQCVALLIAVGEIWA